MRLMSKYKIFINVYVINYMNSEKSYEDIDSWLKDLKSNASPDIKIFLIGNKADLEEQRRIPKEKAEGLKNDYELDLFMETSAKTGLNAQELFAEAAKLLFQDYCKYKVIKSKKEGEQLKAETNSEPQKKKKCC